MTRPLMLYCNLTSRRFVAVDRVSFDKVCLTVRYEGQELMYLAHSSGKCIGYMVEHEMKE